MKVALIDSDRERCGIREHSNLLRAAVAAADPGIEIVSDPAWLDPQTFQLPMPPDVVHLNYHRALHSRWTPLEVQTLAPAKVVITFHDTYETQPDSLPWNLLQVSDAMIVHEPCDLLELSQEPWTGKPLPNPKVHYWRQGVPEPDGQRGPRSPDWNSRPIVGTCGFAFPWKGFELLCDAAASVGWSVLILSHNATDEQVADWHQRNSWAYVVREYLSTAAMIAYLAECDATAFLYTCQNSGTSAAIRLGIAAGKPLLATAGCRQFRDLQEIDRMVNLTGIRWIRAESEVVQRALAQVTLERFSSPMVQLREKDSWRHLGAKYAALYRSLVA